MPPSQLKSLKASLREKGIIGPQQSKKQKSQARDGTSDRLAKRHAALQDIRDRFNPFEVKISQKSKYEFVTSVERPASTARPGVTKGLGEERRKKTLLREMQQRQKVGGVMDRRFGEDDPGLAPEEKALERFVQEKRFGRKNLFNLEDDSGEELTHLGKALDLDEDSDLNGSGDEQRRAPKRRKVDPDVDRPKSKQEAMKDVIAKSKQHKYDRQRLKEDDDDLRAELDQELTDVYALLGAKPKAPPPRAPPSDGLMNPDRAVMLGKDRAQADKEYDERMRQMTFDARSKPTSRTKTEEEKVEEDARRLKELEAERQKRMRGEESEEDPHISDDDPHEFQDDTYKSDDHPHELDDETHDSEDDSQESTIKINGQLGVEDEDDFLFEDISDETSDEEEIEGHKDPDHDNDLKANSEDEDFLAILGNDSTSRTHPSSSSTLAFTYPCPESHQELQNVLSDVPSVDIPLVIQRIRSLYHPKLAETNKEKLGLFTASLVDHISFLSNEPAHPPFVVLEAMIRHIHSLAKVVPEHVGHAFRRHLKAMQDWPTAGDLIILTAISSIFPTSDHFHQVATPAMLTMGRFLSRKSWTAREAIKNTFVATLCLRYQRLSKRYIPELVNHCLRILKMFPLPTVAFCPSKADGGTGVEVERKLQLWDIYHHNERNDINLSRAIVLTTIHLIDHLAEMWKSKAASCEILEPLFVVLKKWSSPGSALKVSTGGSFF